MFAGEGAVVLGVAFVGVWRPLLVRGLGETVIAMEDAWDGMDGWMGWIGLDWIIGKFCLVVGRMEYGRIDGVDR